LLESIVSQGINHSDVFYLLGESYRLLESHEKAQEMLQKAIYMKVHPPYAYFSLGKVFQAKQMFRESIEQFQEFLHRIENADGHYELGRSFMWMGYFEEAVEEFSVCIDMKKHINLDPAVFVLRAEAYEELERFDLAKRDYRAILKINPNFYAPYLEYAEELAAAGMLDEWKNIIDFVRYRTRGI
jgi:tetratricopeptide (TPR) repeat protein